MGSNVLLQFIHCLEFSGPPKKFKDSRDFYRQYLTVRTFSGPTDPQINFDKFSVPVGILTDMSMQKQKQRQQLLHIIYYHKRAKSNTISFAHILTHDENLQRFTNN